MPNDELLHQIALTCIPLVGDVRAKALVQTFGSAKDVFKAPFSKLKLIEGIGELTAKAIKEFNDFQFCEKELAFIQKHNIDACFFTDENYPQRLLNCYDGPALLYYKGSADLNTSKILSIVGTRNNTEYGRQITEKLIEDLQQENILIVSGLAFGIDTIAHKSAIHYNLQTVGVLAHGLDRIYPPINTNLSKQMIENGGLLTDFPTGTKPDRQNFPRRNRIVAGICDALVVVESSKTGGSLITAELANSYNKDIFAFPGRVTEQKSEGCNFLIRTNRASLLNSAEDILEAMNWKPKVEKKKIQRELFINLSPSEETILNYLKEGLEQGMSIDQITANCQLTGSEIAQALLMLEMHGIVQSLPGKIYKMM